MGSVTMELSKPGGPMDNDVGTVGIDRDCPRHTRTFGHSADRSLLNSRYNIRSMNVRHRHQPQVRAKEFPGR